MLVWLHLASLVERLLLLIAARVHASTPQVPMVGCSIRSSSSWSGLNWLPPSHQLRMLRGIQTAAVLPGRGTFLPSGSASG